MFSLNSCYKCQIYYWNKKKMRCHTRKQHSIISNGRTYICQTCGKGFRSQHTLSAHFQNKHTTNGRQFECYLCRKALGYLQTLKLHLKRMHSNGKILSCKY